MSIHQLRRRFDAAALARVGRLVESETLTCMAIGGIGVNVKPVIDSILLGEGLPRNDAVRSGLIALAAQHSAILQFLVDGKSEGFSLDATIAAATQAAFALPAKKDFSPGYHAAIATLAEVMSKYDLHAYTRWRDVPEATRNAILTVAAERVGTDDLTERMQALAWRSMKSVGQTEKQAELKRRIQGVLCDSGVQRMSDGTTSHYHQCLFFVEDAVDAMRGEGIEFSSKALKAATRTPTCGVTVRLDGDDVSCSAVGFSIERGKALLSFETASGWKTVPHVDAQSVVAQSPDRVALLVAVAAAYRRVADDIADKLRFLGS